MLSDIDWDMGGIDRQTEDWNLVAGNALRICFTQKFLQLLVREFFH